jgi:integrase
MPSDTPSPQERRSPAWWRIYCLPSKKISTCTGYESTIIWHIKPHLGKVSLQELKPMQVQAMINQLVKEGKAPSTIRKAQALLHCALEQAIVNGMLIHNPAERTILPRMERKEIQFLTLEEQRRFIAALTDNTPGRALYFILGTGLRAAELTGLR